MKRILTTTIALLILSSCNSNETPNATTNPLKVEHKMELIIGKETFTASLYENATAKAFKAILPITLHMNDYNNNEKVTTLPQSIPTTETNPNTIHTGDIMLFGRSSLVLFYETFATHYRYSPIGKIKDPAKLKAALGRGNVQIRFILKDQTQNQ